MSRLSYLSLADRRSCHDGFFIGAEHAVSTARRTRWRSGQEQDLGSAYPEKKLSKPLTTPTGVLNALMSQIFSVSSPGMER